MNDCKAKGAIKMNIVITGGTGFVGRALTDSFASAGDHVFVLTRHPSKDQPGKSFVEWLTDGSKPEERLKGEHIDAFINLAGDPINKGRWTQRKKAAILKSRLLATQKSIHILREMDKKPRVFINASAIGYYGYSTNITFTEESEPLENSFPSRVCKRWEAEALEVEKSGIRTIIARLGVVMGKDGGALPKMVMPYRFYAGGTVGTGKQWLSWVHIQDVAHLFRFMIEHDQLSGPINVTAPHPVRMEQLGQTISDVLKRPHWLPMPEWAMKALFGEMSGFLLQGQKVLPRKVLETGYTFRFEHVEEALADIL